MSEWQPAPLRSRQMSEHTLRALCAGYARYLMRRTGLSAERIREHFLFETGETPESDPARFRKWAGAKCYVMDQLRQPPFAECA